MPLDTLTTMGIATGVVSLCSCGLLAHHESTVRILHCGARPRSADEAVPKSERESAWARLGIHALLATEQTVAILAVATLHLTLLLLSSMLVYATGAGASPPTNAQIDATAVTAALVACIVLVFDLVYDAAEWYHCVANVVDSFFGAGPRGRRARAELAAERVTATPMAWVVSLALHVAYAATVPLQQTPPPEILRGGSSTEEGMAANASSIVLASVTLATFAGLMLARALAIYLVNGCLAGSDAIAAVSEEACFAVHWQYTAEVTVDAVVRVAALVDAVVTAFILAVRPYKQDIARAENWHNLYIGLVVCLPVAVTIVGVVYALNCTRTRRDDKTATAL